MKINPELLPTRQVATAYRNGGYTNLPNGNIPMTNIITNGSDLTLYNGGIRIGKGIKTVLASGQLFFQASANNVYVWTALKLNSATVSISLTNPSTYFTSTCHSPRILEVNEGDVIYIAGLEAKNGTVRDSGNTYITVEVIE